MENLGELIAAHMAVPGDVPEQKPEANFIISGLRAAISVNPIARHKILSDIANIIDCRAQDLEFLFSDNSRLAAPSQKSELMVPDFQTRLFAIAE